VQAVVAMLTTLAMPVQQTLALVVDQVSAALALPVERAALAS